jgi:hypothetical protein
LRQLARFLGALEGLLGGLRGLGRRRLSAGGGLTDLADLAVVLVQPGLGLLDLAFDGVDARADGAVSC